MHHESAPTPAAVSFRQFMATENVAVAFHRPYSPDLLSCDFLLPRMNSQLRGVPIPGYPRYSGNITKSQFERCFQLWQKGRTLHKLGMGVL